MSTNNASSSDASDYLRSASFSRREGVASSSEPIQATDLLYGAFDPQKLHPLANIGDNLDFLQLEDDKITEMPGAGTAVPSRGWNDDLTYGTGTGYLSDTSYPLVLMSYCLMDGHAVPRVSPLYPIWVDVIVSPSHVFMPHFFPGLALGGVWGIREGVSRPLAVSNARLRLNSVLNAVTRRGTFVGNSAGVMALTYNAINSTVDAFRGKHDIYGSMAAGGLTGALYKSTAGLRPAIAAASLVAGFAGLWSYVKKRV